MNQLTVRINIILTLVRLWSALAFSVISILFNDQIVLRAFRHFVRRAFAFCCGAALQFFPLATLRIDFDIAETFYEINSSTCDFRWGHLWWGWRGCGLKGYGWLSEDEHRQTKRMRREGANNREIWVRGVRGWMGGQRSNEELLYAENWAAFVNIVSKLKSRSRKSKLIGTCVVDAAKLLQI